MIIATPPRFLSVVLLCVFLPANSLFPATVRAEAQSPLSAQQIVDQMVRAESAANKERDHFLYREVARSARTKGHLWKELVIETEEGRLRRLVAEDGRPLSTERAQAENQRITNLVNHPDVFRREAESRKQDEARMANVLNRLPQIYQFRIESTQGDLIRIAFAPNPAFQEDSYQDRVVHAMSGVLSIHQPDMRLCGIEAHLDHKVEFGFGLLGEVSDESHFSIVRAAVDAGQWKTTRLLIHVDGNMLLLKSFSRDEDASHYGFNQVGENLTVLQAANILRATTF
jgi:hypothetical protein